MRKVLTEFEGKQLLKRYGIRVPWGIEVSSPDEVPDDVPLPAAVKVSSREILHKTDVGGVKLNLNSVEEVKRAVSEILQKFPGARALVEAMARPGIEIIVGVIKDQTFGHAIMFGLGGIFTEVLKDVTFRVIPISRVDAEEMLTEIKGRKLLEGFRGMKVDREAIVNLLLSVSRLVEENPGIVEMDLNPVFAREDGVEVVDVKVILEE